MAVDKNAMAQIFVNAVDNVLGMMFMRTIHTLETSFERGGSTSGDISGIIGLTGGVTGTATLFLPGTMAMRLVADILGMPAEGGIHDPLVRDGVGELINMIAGNAKTKFAETDTPFSITLPTIITGTIESVYCKHGSSRIFLLFESVEDDARFSVEVMLQGE